ncbi:MAG: hypothetical protein ACRDT0_27100 [Pseudonocardiaceae bacterium]
MAGGVGRRVVASTVVTAVVTSAAAVVINLATEWKSNLWAWLAVVVVTVLVAAAALWSDRYAAAAGPPAEGATGGQSVSHATINRDNVQIGRARDVTIDHDR